MVLVPDGDPDRTKTLCIPSDKVPSVVLKVCVVPDNESVTTPLKTLSMMSKFKLVVSPQVPDCSPVPIFSIPLFAVYELGIYSTLSVQVSFVEGVTSVQVSPVWVISDHESEAPVDISAQVPPVGDIFAQFSTVSPADTSSHNKEPVAVLVNVTTKLPLDVRIDECTAV